MEYSDIHLMLSLILSPDSWHQQLLLHSIRVGESPPTFLSSHFYQALQSFKMLFHRVSKIVLGQPSKEYPKNVQHTQNTTPLPLYLDRPYRLIYHVQSQTCYRSLLPLRVLSAPHHWHP